MSTAFLDSWSDLILWDVVEEHFDEAEFLYEQWESALRSPRYTLADISRTIERRLEAHTDGLVVGGPDVVARLLDRELVNEDEPARATIAALAMLGSGDNARAARVIDICLSAEGPLQAALSRSLVLANIETLDRVLLDRFHDARSDAQTAVLLEMLTARGVDVGNPLRRCAESRDQRLISATVEAAGRFGRRELISEVEACLESDDARSRATAIKAGLVLGSECAWKLCRQLAQPPRVDDPDILPLLALLGRREDHEPLYAHVHAGACLDRVLWALGFCGTVEAVDTCLAHLGHEKERVAKAAAESIAWIGGFSLMDQRFRSPAPEPPDEETLPPSEEDDLDAELTLDGIDDIPHPNREAVVQWWRANSGRFDSAQRYVLGRAYSSESAMHALEAGPLWRRHAIALELHIRTGGAQHVSTDSFFSRQRRAMHLASVHR